MLTTLQCMDGIGMGSMTTWMLVWGLIGLALLAGLVAGTIWLARRTGGRRATSGQPTSPDEILRRRYAAGELDEDEYFRMRAGLKD